MYTHLHQSWLRQAARLRQAHRHRRSKSAPAGILAEICLPALLAACLAATGCLGPVRHAAPVEPRPLGSDIATSRTSMGDAEASRHAEASSNLEASRQESKLPEPAGVIGLGETLVYALLNSPDLAAYSLQVRIADAQALQAGFYRNPEFGVEVENVGGSGSMEGVDSAETTISLGQVLELGGEPSKRRAVASLEKTLAQWDYEGKRLDVLTAVTRAFIDVLATQERLNLAEELVRISEQVLAAVSERVAAGKDSPIARTKAEVALAQKRIDRERIWRELQAARKALAASWGSDVVSFTEVTGHLDDLPPVPDSAVLFALVEENPDIARWAAELERRKAVVDLEEARVIPNLTVYAGARHFNATDDAAAVFGFSLPLPVFDRNQGAIRAAEYAVSKARHERKAALAQVYAALARAYGGLTAATGEVRSLDSAVLPGARSAFNATRRAFREGKMDYLMVLDAQRTLFAARQRRLEALWALHRARVEVERLIGREIRSLPAENKNDKGETNDGTEKE